MNRQNYSTGTKWESLAGYSRAVRVGKQVWVSGTTATDRNGTIIGIGDPYAQTLQVLSNIEMALAETSMKLQDVVRTRMYVVDIAANWEPVARAHGEVFGQVRPAATMVEVKGLIEPEMLVEIEAEAILSESG